MAIPAQPPRSTSTSNFAVDDERGLEIFRAAIPRMYLWIVAGAAATGAVAWLTHLTGLVDDTGVAGYAICIVVWLAGLFALSVFVGRMGARRLTLLYLSFCVVGGLTSARVFGDYTNESIVAACVLTAATFALMAAITLVKGRELYTRLPLLLLAVLAVLVAVVLSALTDAGFWGWTLTVILPPLSLLMVALGINNVQASALEAVWQEVTQPVHHVAIRGAIGPYITLFTIVINSTGSQHTIFQGRLADRGESVRPGGKQS